MVIGVRCRLESRHPTCLLLLEYSSGALLMVKSLRFLTTTC